ncbi:expressed unknown protein [Seminavis robusta]|uniref:G-protein coupled receptors family 1 profile domain-containing protein n=1 Tax=Seminavis robusta TaxID=568900 RepID=A0A9N8HKZ4_9STRA|nr:expressed unknown protein [Seminavis robusta]|eukprot:Sro788_g202500.1 n/a (305) ;mRNA; r:12987-14066
MPSFESVLLTLAPATSGILSLVGSSWIIWMLVPKCRQRSSSSNDNKLDQVKYRLLLGISVTDVFFSLVILPWALYMPANDTDVWGAMGNKQTCAAQGFLIQLGHMSSFYQAGLSHYYYTTICHGMSNQDFRRYYERIIHVSAVVWPLITAVAALVMDLYNPMSIGCWMAPYPLGCNIDGSDIPCQRGRWAPVFAYVFTGIPVSLFMTYIGYTMLQIYFKYSSTPPKHWATLILVLYDEPALSIKSDQEIQHRPSQRRHSITAGMATTVPVQQYSSQALGNSDIRTSMTWRFNASFKSNLTIFRS